MILVFGVGFVLLGVGSGGLDLGSLLQDIGSRGGSSGPSISKAQEKIDKNPRNAAARRELARAYSAKGQNPEAIAAYQQYLNLRPRDMDAFTELAALQEAEARAAGQQLQVAYVQQSFASAPATFGVPTDSRFGKALGTDPIANVVQSQASTAFQQANSAYQTAVQAVIATYQKMVKVEPTADKYRALGDAAQRYQDYPTAIKAYEQALKRTDDPTLKTQLRSSIKALRAASQATGG